MGLTAHFLSKIDGFHKIYSSHANRDPAIESKSICKDAAALVGCKITIHSFIVYASPNSIAIYIHLEFRYIYFSYIYAAIVAFF